MTTEEGGERIPVYIRLRPLNDKEAGQRAVWITEGDTGLSEATATEDELEQCGEKGRRVLTDRVFRFSKVFGDEVPTQQVYETTTSAFVEDAMGGINATIFAYGQTGSGKTYTMTEGEGGGVVGLALKHIFSHVEKHSERQFLLRASYFEIYNEEATDLLDKKASLKVRERANDFYLEGLTEEIVTTYQEAVRVLKKGQKAKTMGVSNINDHSSRSHTLLRLIIESTQKPPEGEEVDSKYLVKCATLNLVDLAGSEALTDQYSATQRKETKMINQSLAQLKTVIQTLSKGEKFIPFRNSILTKILKSSLGGNSHCGILCCVSPAQVNRRETRDTLRFGAIASNIENKPTVNESADADAEGLISAYKMEVSMLRGKLQSVSVLELEKQQIEQAYRELQDRMDQLMSKEAELNEAKTALKDLTLSYTGSLALTPAAAPDSDDDMWEGGDGPKEEKPATITHNLQKVLKRLKEAEADRSRLQNALDVAHSAHRSSVEEARRLAEQKLMLEAEKKEAESQWRSREEELEAKIQAMEKEWEDLEQNKEDAERKARSLEEEVQSLKAQAAVSPTKEPPPRPSTSLGTTTASKSKNPTPKPALPSDGKKPLKKKASDPERISLARRQTLRRTPSAGELIDRRIQGAERDLYKRYRSATESRMQAMQDGFERQISANQREESMRRKMEEARIQSLERRLARYEKKYGLLPEF